jgi:hypothetical protein
VKYSLAKTYLHDLGTLYAMILRNKREENPDFGNIYAKSYAKWLVLYLRTRPYSNFSQRCCRYPKLTTAVRALTVRVLLPRSNFDDVISRDRFRYFAWLDEMVLKCDAIPPKPNARRQP